MQDMIRISKALADETRIRMLKLLLDRDICACEMQQIFPLSVSQLSRNLRMLMEAGFLKRWRAGKCMIYMADRDNGNRYCRALLDLLADSYNSTGVILKDRKKLEQVMANKLRVC